MFLSKSDNSFVCVSPDSNSIIGITALTELRKLNFELAQKAFAVIYCFIITASFAK